MFNIVQRRAGSSSFSGAVILAGLIAMAISVATYPEHSPLRLSIDFTGGSLFEVQFQPLDKTKPTLPFDEAQVSSVFTQNGVQDVFVQASGRCGR